MIVSGFPGVLLVFFLVIVQVRVHCLRGVHNWFHMSGAERKTCKGHIDNQCTYARAY